MPWAESSHPTPETALPLLPRLCTSPAACDKHPTSGKSLLPSPVVLYKLLENWF